MAFDQVWPKLEPLRKMLAAKQYYITRIADAAPCEQEGLIPVSFDGESVFTWQTLFTSTERYAHQVSEPQTTLAALQYTGGTTGASKGVMLTHCNLGINAWQVVSLLDLKRDDQHVSMAVLPLFHAYGLVTCLLMSTCVAAMLVPVPRYSPQEVLELIKDHRPTIFPGAPSIYISMLQHKNIGEYDLRCIRYGISGSAPMPVERLKQFVEATGAHVIEGYGLTEASPVTHMGPPDGSAPYGSIGKPLPFTHARIVDREVGSLLVPTGVHGELVVRGPQVMLGYWNNPDETASALRNGWLYTGDIAKVDENGFYYILDRKKDMYIVGGFNVYPREIDEVLHEHPKILEAVAVGVPHSTRGESIKAFVVPKPGETLTKEEVITYCRKKLASYKVPRAVEFANELPKSAVGKVLRRLLLDEERRRKQAKAKSSASLS
jgi:long-chain acyl-CoA synthetase